MLSTTTTGTVLWGLREKTEPLGFPHCSVSESLRAERPRAAGWSSAEVPAE